MRPVSTISGRATPLALDNVDTDQLCAARFMKRRRAEGYGDALLHDLRRTPDGEPRPNPIDDRPGAILLAGRNFGGGSSREAAVYAVLDAGYRAVVASSFGDIFAANAARNGLVPAIVGAGDLARLLAVADSPFTLDLERLTIAAEGVIVPFTLDPARRTMLLEGLDDVDMTARHRAAIDAFVARDRKARPYAQAPGEGVGQRPLPKIDPVRATPD